MVLQHEIHPTEFVNNVTPYITFEFKHFSFQTLQTTNNTNLASPFIIFHGGGMFLTCYNRKYYAIKYVTKSNTNALMAKNVVFVLYLTNEAPVTF